MKGATNTEVKNELGFQLTAKDLRIGNYVKCLSEDRQVLYITKHNGNNETARYYIGFKGIIPIKLIHIKPIPLTEEWLIKFGFKIEEDFYEIVIQEKPLVYLSIDAKNKQWSIGANLDWSYPLNIKHVHQLQNLYFSLTNKELNYDTKQNN